MFYPSLDSNSLIQNPYPIVRHLYPPPPPDDLQFYPLYCVPLTFPFSRTYSTLMSSLSNISYHHSFIRATPTPPALPSHTLSLTWGGKYRPSLINTLLWKKDKEKERENEKEADWVKVKG